MIYKNYMEFKIQCPQIKSYWNTVILIYTSPVATLALQGQSWEWLETISPTKPKIVTIWPFVEKVANPWIRVTLQSKVFINLDLKNKCMFLNKRNNLAYETQKPYKLWHLISTSVAEGISLPLTNCASSLNSFYPQAYTFLKVLAPNKSPSEMLLP